MLLEEVRPVLRVQSNLSPLTLYQKAHKLLLSKLQSLTGCGRGSGEVGLGVGCVVGLGVGCGVGLVMGRGVGTGAGAGGPVPNPT